MNGKLKIVIETSARLLRLLSLFQARRYWSGASLAERLEVTARTLRRDVDRLRSLGYPVHSTSGIAGGYQLGAGATLPPLLLDDEEAVAVAVGLRTAASGTVTGLEEASVRALTKLEQVLPSRLRHRVAALNSAVVPLLPAGPAIDAGTLSLIAGACRDNESLRFSYRSHDGTASSRIVEPHRLVHTGRRWYLVAFDTNRENWRTFRLDRIAPKIFAGARFTPRQPPDRDLAAYVSKSVAWAPYKYRASVKLHASAETVAEVIPQTVGLLEAIDQKACILHTGAESLDRLCVWLALIGFEFEVRDPPELRERVQWLAGRFTRASASKG
jgi:predicted DNA-binding transcriptional regulator YafY